MPQISHAEGIWDGFHVKSNKILMLLGYIAALETCQIADWWKKCINTHWIGETWESKSKKLFETLRIDNLLFISSPCKAQCIRKAKEKPTNIDREIWYNSLSDGKDANNGNKLRTYRFYKSTFQAKSYVKFNMSRDQHRILSTFRSCNLPLAIEMGCFTKPKTPLKDHICKFCSASSVEDETHFLIECEFYNDIRYDLFKSASELNDNFCHFNPEEKLSFLMNTDSLQFNIANCLLTMSKRRKHANI